MILSSMSTCTSKFNIAFSHVTNSWLCIRKIHCSKLTILHRAILACLWPAAAPLTTSAHLTTSGNTECFNFQRANSISNPCLYSITISMVLSPIFIIFNSVYKPILNLQFKCLLESFHVKNRCFD